MRRVCKVKICLDRLHAQRIYHRDGDAAVRYRQPRSREETPRVEPVAEALTQCRISQLPRAQHSLKSRISSVGLYCALSEPTGAEISGMESLFCRKAQCRCQQARREKNCVHIELNAAPCLPIVVCTVSGRFSSRGRAWCSRKQVRCTGAHLQFGPMFFLAFASTSA